MALVMFETRVCALVGGREKRPYQDGHGIRFVTVRHVPVVAGETRPFSDVSAPGGGDVLRVCFSR
ncbi:hypothetical protein IGI04_020163 [Brassica rapa subsp. trilocularis]|uniref:Uncharacterized protein n=1 Tax=Brassica rapa subsp. trilocularis TaxID=1813537 RepID=A0ABQ7MHZ5_BRACM|nr:hypothetical protein IGI04_020163 [Brassica rapa subsp. trilocularis]